MGYRRPACWDVPRHALPPKQSALGLRAHSALRCTTVVRDLSCDSCRLWILRTLEMLRSAYLSHSSPWTPLGIGASGDRRRRVFTEITTCSLAHLLTCSLAHLLTSSLAHLLTGSLAPSLPRSLARGRTPRPRRGSDAQPPNPTGSSQLLLAADHLHRTVPRPCP
jgi:hypothetical protein